MNDAPQSKMKGAGGFRLCFVGGVFGAGKSTLCQEIARVLPARHAKASELLQFQSQSHDSTGKAVADVPRNQERLVEAVAALRTIPQIILLDGHFCLWDSNHSVIPVPLDIFRRLNPMALVLVEAEAHDVVERLQQRDGRRFDKGLLEQLLGAEREHARSVAEAIGVPLFVADGLSRSAVLAEQLQSTLGGRD